MTARHAPRRSRTWPIVAGIVASVTVTSWGGALLLDRPGTRPIPFVPPADASTVPVQPVPLQPVFAESDGVALRLPSDRVVEVAFHEASYDDAMALRPLGVCRVCRNRWKFEPPPVRAPEQTYIVTDTRDRSTPATSAADVVLPGGAEVLSPVSGTVTEVKHYRLYRRYPDVRITIRPRGVPDRRVVMLHLAGVTLERGDRVEASATRIGIVRRFDFESQVDRYVPGGFPHVHMEVKDPAAAPRPSTRS